MLEEAEKLISSPECQKWVNEQLELMGAPAGRNRLDFLVAHADINKYSPNLSPSDLGVDDKRHGEYKRKYLLGEAYGFTPQVGGNHHIYLYQKAFHRESWYSVKENVDTPGVIVHELFRVAGIDDKTIRKFHTSLDLFDKRITTHCGIKGYIH